MTYIKKKRSPVIYFVRKHVHVIHVNIIQCQLRYASKFIFVSACRSGEFPCNDGLACIDGRRFQDGKDDCKDGSDEGERDSPFEITRS